MSDDHLVDYVLRHGGSCRDCADADGVCPTRGVPCDVDVERATVKHAVAAMRYGVQNGFLPNPFQDVVDAAREQARREALEEAARIADNWLAVFGEADPQYISAKQFASDAVKDVAQVIREVAAADAPTARAADVRCSVGTMTTSAGTDYFVVLRMGDREMTPHSYSIRGRAELDVAQWRYFFGQTDEEPDILAFDTDG